MENMYLSLIGDIVGSRKINFREELQAKLENALSKVNSDYKASIESKFLITVGDEFQGLLKPTVSVYKIICSIAEAIYPVQVRFGLGLGRITTPVKEEALGMDGPAFYAAREALKDAHKKKEHATVFKSELNVLDREIEEAINVMLGSLAVIKKLWPESFYKILPHLRKGKSQKEIASLIETTQPYISKLVNNAYWKEVELLEEQVERLLSFYLSSNSFYNYKGYKSYI